MMAASIIQHLRTQGHVNNSTIPSLLRVGSAVLSSHLTQRHKSTDIRWKKHRRAKQEYKNATNYYYKYERFEDKDSQYKAQYNRFKTEEFRRWPIPPNRDPKLNTDRKRYKTQMRQSANINSSETIIDTSSTMQIMDQYVPPKDEKSSLLSKMRVSRLADDFGNKGKSTLAARKIRKFEGTFDFKDFAVKAQNIYLEAHELLNDFENNQDKLHKLVTEYAYWPMTEGLDKNTIRWKFVESVEPPKVVRARNGEVLIKDNLFSQVTVRLHIKQILAIYDQFGRLMYGDPEMEKSAIEYVVFEKHIADTYGIWRIHSKVSTSDSEPIIRTYKDDRPAMPKNVQNPQEAPLINVDDTE